MSETLWTATDAANATSSHSTADWQAGGISIDSRTLQPGDLFVALHGPHFDGHDYVRAAQDAGAAACMVDHEIDGVTLPQLLVEDTLAGLRALARMARARAVARVAAVTGSVGKTGAKEALRHILAPQGAVHASAASLNNHWGVPLSLALLPRNARFAIFEIGMNHPGEIEPLSRLIHPDVALITNVEAVHLGPMGSLDAIADAKGEIFAGLEADGTAILNRDSHGYERLRALAPPGALSFSATGRADAIFTSLRADAQGSSVEAIIAGHSVSYRVPLPGRHLAENSLGILLTAAALGADLDAAAEAYGSLQPVKGRGNRQQVPAGSGTATLIDETHNASPVATRAAIGVLAQMQPRGEGRRIAVLGDMLELGDGSTALHRALAHDLLSAGVDAVFACGSEMAHLFADLPAELRGGHAPDSAKLLPMLREAMRDGDVVLVKGSRGSRMKVIVEALAEQDHGPTHAL